MSAEDRAGERRFTRGHGAWSLPPFRREGKGSCGDSPPSREASYVRPVDTRLDNKATGVALMDYVRLGRTGLKVSRLALGCMSYGDPTTANAHTWALDDDDSAVLPPGRRDGRHL